MTSTSSTFSRTTMLLWLLAARLTSMTTHAWISSTSFVGTPTQLHHSTTRRHDLSMDLESPSAASARASKVLQRFQLSLPTATRTKIQVPRPCSSDDDNYKLIDETAALHGMPWKTSIDPAYHERHRDDKHQHLFYMPFWEWQLAFMKQHLSNLRVLPCVSRAGDDLSLVQNTAKKMRLHTMQFQSDEYKCIRMTVLDAGPRTQVFTSLWYPRATYNLPIMGADLLQFGETRHLCICDFQPIQEREYEHDARYQHLLKPIRDQYPSLQGKMTQRFYDENAFFSNQILLGRCNVGEQQQQQTSGTSDQDDDKNTVVSLDDARQMVYGDVFPAYQQYVQTHVNLVQSTVPRSSQEEQLHVLERHAAYDTYSAARDPAHGLLASSFGHEFADAYVHDILFPLSERKVTTESTTE